MPTLENLHRLPTKETMLHSVNLRERSFTEEPFDFVGVATTWPSSPSPYAANVPPNSGTDVTLSCFRPARVRPHYL